MGDRTRPGARPWWANIRFSLRVLILVVLTVGGGLGWVVNQARIQRDAVTAIQKAGGVCLYDWDFRKGAPNPNGTPMAPRWLVDRLGVDYFGHVVSVWFASRHPTWHWLESDLSEVSRN